MAVVSVATIAWLVAYPHEGQKISISFVSNSVKYAENPGAFLGIATMFIFAGIVGLSILFQWKLAFDLGIGYCATAFLFLGTLTAMGTGVVNDPFPTYVVLFLVFGGLGAYFLKRRKQWINC
jgi:hypothetical protein